MSVRTVKEERQSKLKRSRTNNEVIILITEGLILAQSERWRRVLGMQVDRQHDCSNTVDGERQTGE